MTPQPQPASYWIELLEELTGGIPFEITQCKHNPTSLKFFFMIYTNHFDRDFYDKMFDEVHYITSGQNVIDAAVEFATSIPSFEKRMNLVEQTSLYLRCNGIKR